MSRSEDMAKDRTDWAEDRTIMANERTFLSWIGAGMAAIGLALAFKAIFGAFEPTWIAKTISTVPLIAATLLFFVAQKNARKTLARLTERDVETSGPRNFILVAALLALTAVGTAFILWGL